MNMNKLYLIANNDKKFASWCKEKRKKLHGSYLEMFDTGQQDVRYASYFARASFISYWEIQLNGSLAKIAPAITQGTMISLQNKLLAIGKIEEAEILSNMMSNFLSFLLVIGDEEE